MSSDNGGAIYLTGNSSFEDKGSLFLNNSALEGGAIYCVDCRIILKDSKASGNIAMNGGFISFESLGVLEGEGLQIEDNEAMNSGGALKFGSSTWFSIKNSTFTRNLASNGSGSAIYALGTSQIYWNELWECDFMNNRAEKDIIQMVFSFLRLYGGTWTDNESQE